MSGPIDDPGMIIYGDTNTIVTALALAVAVPFVPAWGLTTFLGRALGMFWIGSGLAISFPFVLAIVDPDGSCDPSDYCFFDISPGAWFAIGVVAAVPPWIGWVLGVATGNASHKRRIGS